MRAVIGIFNSENQAVQAIETLKSSGINIDNIQLISKYSLLREDEASAALVDPNANIFSLDNNGLDVPLGEEMDATLARETFTTKLNTILFNTINDNDVQATIARAEEAGYVVVVETDSPGVFNKASEILKPSAL